MKAGRCRTWARARVRSALVAAPGATRLRGPRDALVSEGEGDQADNVVDVDPGQPLAAVAQAAASAGAEGGRHAR